MMQATYHHIAISIVLAGVFSFCIWRDIQIEKQYTADIRNRVVGARLQMDGKPPYFYRWRPGDSLRYYDPIKFDTTYASGITASPFFHHLLFPIANLQQRQISRIWLGFQYAMYFICMLIAFSFAKNIAQHWAVTIAASLFLFTEGWFSFVTYGQIYIVFPFFAFLFLFFLERKSTMLFSFLSGLAAVALFLSRPTTALLFLPFLFFLKRYSLKYLLIFFIPVFALLSYSMLNKNERSFWIDYRKAIAAHIKHHQSEDAEARNLAYKPVQYKNWEGWNEDSINHARNAYTIQYHFELAGVQVILMQIFHKKIPYTVLNFSCVVIIVSLMICFYFRQRQDASFNIALTTIFGFCLYMISDFFSPVTRFQYYSVQWVFPLLLCAAYYNPKLKTMYFLLLAGIILNIINAPYIKMRHTVGEYLILFTLLWLCLSPQSRLLK